MIISHMFYSYNRKDPHSTFVLMFHMFIIKYKNKYAFGNINVKKYNGKYILFLTFRIGNQYIFPVFRCSCNFYLRKIQ